MSLTSDLRSSAVAIFFFKQKTAYEIHRWSSDVCSSDLAINHQPSTINMSCLPSPITDHCQILMAGQSDGVSGAVEKSRPQKEQVWQELSLPGCPRERIDRKSVV